MWCKVCISYENLTRATVPRKFNLPYAISDQTGLLCANFVPTLISPTLYGLLYSVVMFLHQKTKETGIHNPKKAQVSGKKRSRRNPWWSEVVQRWSSAGQLNFNYNILVAVSTNIGLCDRDSTNFRFTVTKNFSEKLKRVEGGEKGPYGYQR